MERVYLSSTYQDLQEHREAVRLQLQRLHLDDVAMEVYVAEPSRPVDKCIGDVRSCDLYIGLFAWRYGHIPKGYERSITEIEYRTAVEHGKDCLIFLLHEDAPWPRSAIERGSDADRIEALRAELAGEHLCSFFSSVEELATDVTTAVAKWLVARRPEPAAVGATTPEDRDEAARDTIAPEELAGYRKRLQRYARLDLDALTPPQPEEYLQTRLQWVFVEPDVREIPPTLDLAEERVREASKGQPPRRALDVLVEHDARRMVLLGDPGAGKSTLARLLAMSVAAVDGDERLASLRGHLPLLIELRTYAGLQAKGECHTLLEFLERLRETEELGFDAGTLDRYLREHPVLVILDGLDEVFDPRQRGTVARQIAGFANTYPKARLLVTSRIIGYRRDTLTDAGFVHHTLQDLDDDQIGHFLTSWYTIALQDHPDEAQRRRQQLQDAIAASRPIRELAGNPLLLTILAIIGRQQRLPRERWKVYDHAATVLVERWDVKWNLQQQGKLIDAEFLDEDDKQELLRRIAYRMQAGMDGLAGNYLPGDALREEFELYLASRYQRDQADAESIATAMVAQFRERSSILGRYGAEVYGFVHRAFLEYFCARALVWQFERSQELTLDQLRHEVVGLHWEDAAWREVLRLVAGMLHERFAGDLITFLACDAYQPWPRHFGDRPPRNLALAVQCLGELRNPVAVGEQAALLLRVLIGLLEHSPGTVDDGRDALLEREIVPAAEAIGEAWPSRETYLDWYVTRGHRIAWFPISSCAALIAAALFPRSNELLSLFLKQSRATDPRIYRAGRDGLRQLLLTNPDARAMVLERAVSDESGGVRWAAVQALGATGAGDPETVAVLRRAAGDDDADVRWAAVQALGATRDRETLAWLRDWAPGYWDAGVRRAVVKVLGATKDRQTLAWLRDRLTGDNDAGVRQAAVQALGATGNRQTLAWLRDWTMKEESAGVRQAAVQALGLAGGRQTRDWLRDRAVKDESGGVRQAAVQALGATRDQQTLAWLRERLRDEDPAVRRAAVEALGVAGAGDPETVAVLRDRVVGDWDAGVRRAAVEAAGIAGDPPLLAWLRDRVAGNESANVRRAAVEALDAAGAGDPETVAVLRQRVAEDRSTGVRQAAVQALGKVGAGDPETVAALRQRVAEDRSTGVRQAAVQALGKVGAGDPETVAALRDQALGDQNPGVRGAAVQALGAAGDRQTLAWLRDWVVGDQDARVRRAAVQALGNAGAGAGDRQTLAWLRDRVTGDNDAGVRQAAAQALGNAGAGDPRTLAWLRDRATSDHDAGVRQAATRAIVAAIPDEPDTLTLLASQTPSGPGFTWGVDYLGRRT